MVVASSVADTTIQECHQAAEQLLQVAGRVGSLLELTPDLADDVLVAGDLHGHRLNFQRLCRLADLENHPRRHLVLQEVCHGGPVYPDNQGCMSHLLVEDIVRLTLNFPGRVHFLLGNHEWAELTDYPIRKGMIFLNYQFFSGISTLYGSRAREVHQAYLKFFEASLLAVRLVNGVLISHSAPPLEAPLVNLAELRRPLCELDLRSGGPVYQLLWGRDYRAEAAERFAKSVDAQLLVHGHEPCPNGFAVPNSRQIILDCSQSQPRAMLLSAKEPVGQAEALQCVVALRR